MSEAYSAPRRPGSTVPSPGDPQAPNSANNLNWPASILDEANGMRSPHAPRTTEIGSPHTPETAEMLSLDTPESTELGSPHTPGTTGRAPQGHYPANVSSLLSSSSEDVYAEASSGQQHLVHPQPEPFHEMGSSSRSFIGNPVSPPAYTSYGIPSGVSDGTANAPYPSYYQQQPYPLPPQAQPYPVLQHQPEMQQRQPNGNLAGSITILSPSSQRAGQFQAINYRPGVNGPSPSSREKQRESDTVSVATYRISSTSSGQRKRWFLCGCCLFIIIIATVLGCVFGIVLKTKEPSGSSGRGTGPSPATTTFLSSTSTMRASMIPFTSTLTTTSTTTSTTAVVPTSIPSPAPPAPPAPPITPAPPTCDCNAEFNNCLDVCTAADYKCEDACRGDMFCQGKCADPEYRCRNSCFSANSRCKC